MSMESNIIYLIKNKLNNKIYIGSAVDGKRRFYHHRFYLNKNSHHNIKLQNAWNKYGEENFVFEIIERLKDKNNLIEREQYYLDKLLFAQEFIINKDKRFYKLGYNICPTASSNLGRIFSEKIRLKLAKKIKQYDLNGNFLRVWNSMSEAARECNTSAGHICECCKSNPDKDGNYNYSAGGFIWKYEEDNTIVNKYVSTQYETILQFDDDGEFIREWEHAYSAEKELNIPRGNILNNCKGKIKYTGGFIWTYKKEGKNKKLPNSSKIIQYDKDGRFIKVWNSPREIEENTGIFSTSITQCCRYKLKLVGGYRWKYYRHEFETNRMKKKYSYLVEELETAAKELGI